METLNVKLVIILSLISFSTQQTTSSETTPSIESTQVPDYFFANITLHEIKYRKCCEKGHVFSRFADPNVPEASQCIPTDPSVNLWPMVYHNRTFLSPVETSPDTLDNITYGFPVCPRYKDNLMMPLGQSFPQFFILSSGEVYFPDFPKVPGSLDLYCVDKKEGHSDHLYGKYCVPYIPIREACAEKLCIPLCCGKDGMWINDSCVSSPVGWNASFYDEFGNSVEEPAYEIHAGFPDACEYEPRRFIPLRPSVEPEQDNFYLQSSGMLYIPENQAHNYWEAGTYCLVQDGEATSESLMAFVCIKRHETVAWVYNYYTALLFLSVIFLILTIIVLVKLPVGTKGKNRSWNLHKKVSLCHCCSLLLAYIFLAISQLTSSFPPQKAVCIALAVLTQFFFLCAFFWLNAMSFDMWWTFSSLSVQPGFGRNRETKKFVRYCMYAFGAPFIITILSIIIHFTPGIPSYIVKPGYGEISCFFKNDGYGLWFYFYGPIAALLLANTFFFIRTAIFLFLHSKEIAPITTNTVQNKYKFWVYLRLYILMGLTWLAELLSWQLAFIHRLVPQETFYFTDTVNGLQGVFIFFAFVIGSSKIKKALKDSFKASSVARMWASASTTMRSYTGRWRRAYDISQESKQQPQEENGKVSGNSINFRHNSYIEPDKERKMSTSTQVSTLSSNRSTSLTSMPQTPTAKTEFSVLQE